MQVNNANLAQSAKSVHVESQTVLSTELGEKVLVDTAQSVFVPEKLRPAEKVVDETAGLDSLLHDKVWWNDVMDQCQVENGASYVEQWPAVVSIPKDGRFAGDPLPFSMTTDGYVSTALLVVFAIAVLLLSRSIHYLAVKAKDFFTSRSRGNLFNETSDARMQGKYFFSFVLCLALGILMFNYQQIFYSETISEVSPYLLMGVNVSIFGVGYLFRTMAYASVNTVFFDRESKTRWMDIYHLLTVAAGILFMLLALLVVFYEMDFSNWRLLFLISVLIVEIFLIFKTYNIFFEGGLGFLHLILYLCTLEFLPLLILWKGAVWVTQELTKLV